MTSRGRAMAYRLLIAISTLSFLVSACDEDVDKGLSDRGYPDHRIYPQGCRVSGTAGKPPQVKLTQVLKKTTITHPVDLVMAPDGTGRIFLLSQPGQVLSIQAQGQ